MPPTLELTQAMLDPPLFKYTAEYLSGAMLFSHKPEIRAEYMQTALSNHLMETVGLVPSARRMLDGEMGEQLWKVRGEAMPTRYWTQDKLRPGIEGGFLTGMVYRAAIEQYVSACEFSIESIKADVLDLARKRRLKIRHAKLENAMKQHRRVAHLWASHVYAVDRFNGHPRDLPFPCGPDGLHDFLFRARWYQEWGLRICPYGNSPLFSAADLLRIPDDLKLVTELQSIGDGTYCYPLPSAYPPGMNLPPLLTIQRPLIGNSRRD